jgi:GntR family transcriptional regulator
VTTLDGRPQYRRIELELRRRIAALPAGARLPSDAELVAEFGVSRMTARNAMQRLDEDGLIERRPGRGSFVAEPPSHRHANHLMTFTQEMLRTGRIPSSRVLTRVIRPSTDEEAALLGLAPREPVVHLQRIRQADGVPMAIESTVLVRSCSPVVMAADVERGSLHEALHRAGIVPRRGTSTIGAATATPSEARLLDLRIGGALIVERRVIVDGIGRRIEATNSRYRADRYALTVRFDVEAPDRR